MEGVDCDLLISSSLPSATADLIRIDHPQLICHPLDPCHPALLPALGSPPLSNSLLSSRSNVRKVSSLVLLSPEVAAVPIHPSVAVA